MDNVHCSGIRIIFHFMDSNVLHSNIMETLHETNRYLIINILVPTNVIQMKATKKVIYQKIYVNLIKLHLFSESINCILSL